MKILLVNPNTTASMTGKLLDTACAVASQRTEIVAVTAGYGPESIEGSSPAVRSAFSRHTVGSAYGPSTESLRLGPGTGTLAPRVE